MVSAGGPTVVRGARGRGHRGQPRGRAQVGPEGSRARGRSRGCAPRLGALGFGGTVGATAPGPSRTWRPSLTPVRGAGRGRAPRAGPGLTTRCLGLASATSISSAPEFSPGEPDRKSIISSSCLLSPSATVWMAVVHSSLQGSQSAEAPAPPRPGASPSEAPGLGAPGLVSSAYRSSGVSTWNVRSMTVVHCRQRMMKVLGRGRSVFISWHSGGRRASVCTEPRPTRHSPAL